MSNNFITNNKQQKTLKGRLNTLISISDELKFLVGYFYFSGWSDIYLSLQKNPQQKIKFQWDYKFVIIQALKRKTPKNNEVYNVDIFHRRQEILDDIDSDIQLFKDIQKRLKDLKLVENDPKQEEIIKKIKRLLANEPNRKIILFSEYVDTIHHLEKRFKSEFKNEVLVCDGKVSKDLARHLNSDFNAQYNRG